MTSRRRARRLDLRWQRYWGHYLHPNYIVTAGTIRAYNRAAHASNQKAGPAPCGGVMTGYNTGTTDKKEGHIT